MCEFQIGTYECRGDGYVWDADCDGYDPEDHSWPCPCCNTKEYLAGAKEEAETTSSYTTMTSSGCGVDIWEGALAQATVWNPDHLEEILKGIGKVVALKHDDNGEENPSVKVFEYF